MHAAFHFSTAWPNQTTDYVSLRKLPEHAAGGGAAARSMQLQYARSGTIAALDCQHLKQLRNWFGASLQLCERIRLHGHQHTPLLQHSLQVLYRLQQAPRQTAIGHNSAEAKAVIQGKRTAQQAVPCFASQPLISSV
jgi:hypothetical protein